MKEELDEEERDGRLVADLDAGRLARADARLAEVRFPVALSIPLYRKAFRVYGLPVGEGDPAAAAARLLRRPLEVRQAVSAVLDEWLGLAEDPACPVREPHRDWLRALAAAELDGSEMLEMRTAWQERDPTRRRAALERLAATADPSRWPPGQILRLTRRLNSVQATRSAVQLLRRAWRQYPADFWVHEDLGNLLRDTEPQARAECVRHLTAAVALRRTAWKSALASARHWLRRGNWTKPSPASAGPSSSTPTTPEPTTTWAWRSVTRAGWTRPSPPSAGPSNSTPGPFGLTPTWA